MTLAQVEKRIALLESEIEQLKRQSAAPRRNGKWYLENSGQFKDDSVYDEIVRRGQEYRKSLRPKAAKKTKKR
ncbi:MAG TPA: hypothetical protein VGR35_21290 [Tepidisphaeraceae bacterium]|nr:hypothetical protein [Tepidisphaeraceae bacterium]